MNVGEPRFLTRDQVERFHTRALREHGGLEGIREPGLLDSALAAAQNAHCYGQADLFQIAATYAFHLAESQAFLDGNKRTAMVAALSFLHINGVVIGTSTEPLYDAMIALAEKRLTKAGLAEILRRLAESH
jgi:death-on-curing protein